MNVDQISAELDICFDELGYKSGECPFEHGWRNDGVPASMVVHFCRRQSSKGRPLKCFVFHRGHKIAEFVPETADTKTPIVTMNIWGHHAYFYSRGKTQDVVSHLEMMKDASPYDQFSTRRVREIYPRHTTPVYSEWRSDNDFINGLVDGFSRLAAEFSSKKRKVNDTGRGDVVQYASDNI